jgi:colanic acid biosynthesis glycosyl transferase WcaI
MKILFVTPYYPPEKGAAMVRISETAKRLVRQGHQVTVLTTVPSYPTGIVPHEYRGRLLQEETREGVRVVRVWSYVSANTSFLKRILPQLSFALMAPLLGGRAIGHPDIIIVQSPPLFDAIAGRLLAWWKRRPFVFLVSDIWPGTPVELGILRNRLMIRFSKWLELSTYQRASAVWALTEGMRDDIVQRGFPLEHVFVITNGVDTKIFHPLPRAQARAELGWGDGFTVLYAGTHGATQGLTTILDAAELMRDRYDVHFVFAGDGAEKGVLKNQALGRQIRNVSFLDSQPHDRMPLLLNAADVCLVPLRKAPLFEAAIPSKLYEIMACGRPIVLGVDGEARRLIVDEAGAGLYVEPEDPHALVAAISHLHDHPHLTDLLGKRGRVFVETHFDRNELTLALERRLAALYEKTWPTSSDKEQVTVHAGVK